MRKYSYPVLFFIPFVLFLILAFAQSSRAAAPPEGGYKWDNAKVTVEKDMQRIRLGVEAQKTYPVSTLDQNGKPIKQMRTAKSVVKIAPAAKNVSKSLFKRVPAMAITQAVIALLGKSVDWLLDPDNNSVKYKDPDGGDFSRKYQSNVDRKRYSSMAQICSLINAVHKTSFPCRLQNIQSDGSGTVFLYNPDDAKFNVDIAGFYDPNFVEEVSPVEWQYIPIDDVSQKIIDHAADGQAPALQVMNDTALDMLEQGLLDAQLDAASDIPQPDPQEITQAQYDNPNYPEAGTGSGTGPETPVDPENPTDPETPTDPEAKPFELPPFCSWASKVCDFIDWVKTEPPEPPESGEVDVQIPDSNMHEGILERLYIDMPAECPPDPVLEFMGARIPFPMSVFCQFAAMMKPLILLFAYIKGLSIIGTGLN